MHHCWFLFLSSDLLHTFTLDRGANLNREDGIQMLERSLKGFVKSNFVLVVEDGLSIK